MRRLTHFTSALFLAAAAIFAVSCDNNEEITPQPTDEYDAVLKVKQDSAETPNVNFNVPAGATSVEVLVRFQTNEDVSMKRLYITRNIQQTGEEAFEPVENVDLKADGSLDLTGKDDNLFEYTFDLPVPDTVENGTVVYSFWTTTGNGDFRDVDQNLAVGPGTITLKFGNAQDPDADDAPVKSFSAKILAAPLQDGSSLTFISLIDGQIFKINDGAEYAALWDFGYYYTNAAGASLASTANYETAFPFVDVDQIAGTTDLNEAFFAASDMTTEDFDGVSVAGDLNAVSAGSSQKISGLAVGDIIEFEDNYGKKGLIRVVEIEGTFNAGDYIKLDIKVQP